jgi:hypothetical protein
MLVLCNGMPRSASTWSYNVVMALLRGTGEEIHGGYDENLHRFLRTLPPSALHAAVKLHSLDGAGIGLAQLHAAKVVYTWRDLADAIASYMTMFGLDFDRTLALMSSSLDLYQHHKRNGALILGYEAILRHAAESVASIAAYLGIATPYDRIAAIAEANSLAKTREKVNEIGSLDYGERLIRHEGTAYDPETLLNFAHIRDGGTGYGASRLNQTQLRRVAELLRVKGPLG